MDFEEQADAQRGWFYVGENHYELRRPGERVCVEGREHS